MFFFFSDGVSPILFVVNSKAELFTVNLHCPDIQHVRCRNLMYQTSKQPNGKWLELISTVIFFFSVIRFDTYSRYLLKILFSGLFSVAS